MKSCQMPPMPDVIFDTVVISNFAKAGQLELLIP